MQLKHLLRSLHITQDALHALLPHFGFGGGKIYLIDILICVDLGEAERMRMFTEISLLMEGELPRGSIPVSLTGSPSNQYWGEVARYVLYEEVFDEETKRFGAPQYPSISYRYFDRFCGILQKGMDTILTYGQTIAS